jgi:NAD-dependent SIR2 family protein deacetylase
VEKFECPNCHQKTIPVWRKMCLGPSIPTACPNCGSRVGVPHSAWLVLMPFAVMVIAVQLVASFAVGAVLVAVGMLAMSWIYYKFVPLIVK